MSNELNDAYEAGKELGKERPYMDPHQIGVAASDYAEISSRFNPDQNDRDVSWRFINGFHDGSSLWNKK